jgi:hypothetical protein
MKSAATRGHLASINMDASFEDFTETNLLVNFFFKLVLSFER